MALWLGFIAYPLTATYSDPRIGVVHLGVVSAVTTVFCGLYVAYCALPDPSRAGLDRRAVVAMVVVLVGAVTFLVFYDRPEWDYSYVFCLWPAVVVSGNRPWPVPLLTGLAVAAGAATGLGGSNVLGVALVVVGVGATTYGVTRLVVANETLRRAHADQAARAVAEERLRFARDLHELLSHSLSVIALKSQVAARLIESQPSRAATEMAEVEQITRQALQEVRDAVSGYRRPSLAAELQGARRALAAAGIALRGVSDPPDLPAGVEAPLAWALREGVTNVIRHSRASTCTIRLDLSADTAVLTVADDGTGPTADGRAVLTGNGLRGLAERVAAVEGTLASGPGVEGGFCLSLSLCLPVTSERPVTVSRWVKGALR